MTPIATSTIRFCEDCEKRISLKRLQAVPGARWCVS